MSSRFEYRLSSWKALALACCAVAVACGAAWGAGSSVPIKGRIVDVDGKPVPGVTVRLAEIVGTWDYSGAQKGVRVSGNSGEFDFGSVPCIRGYLDFVLAAPRSGEWLGWGRYNPALMRSGSSAAQVGDSGSLRGSAQVSKSTPNVTITVK